MVRFYEKLSLIEVNSVGLNQIFKKNRLDQIKFIILGCTYINKTKIRNQ